MNAYSYYELASCLPSDLLLAEEPTSRWPHSRSRELLALAASRTVHSDRVDLSLVVPYAGEYSPLSADEIEDITEIVRLNSDALFVIARAVECQEFRVPASPVFGASRITAAASEMITAVSYLQDILCAQGRLQLAEGKVDAATCCIGNLLGLGDMLCAGGGDMDFYQLGHRARMRVCWMIREFLLCEHCGVEELQKLSVTLKPRSGSTEGYLQSCLSDFYRDVLATFAAYGDDISSPEDLRRWLNNPLVRRLSTSARSRGQYDQTWDANTEFKVVAICRALESNTSPFDAFHTTHELVELYNLFRDAFANRLDTRMADIQCRQARSVVWPEEFQLTSPYVGVVPDTLVAQTARTASSFPNALGKLIIRDIVRAADSVVQQLLIIPWRTRLEMEAIHLIVANCEYQLRCKKRPRSLDELRFAGLLNRAPCDPLTGSQLCMSANGTSVIGPSSSDLRAITSIVSDFPDLRWEIPKMERKGVSSSSDEDETGAGLRNGKGDDGL